MSSTQFPLCTSSGLIDRFKHIFSNTDNVTEGGLWAVWFGFTVSNLKESISRQTQALETNSEKSEKIWNVNKEVLIAGCSTVSSGSMLVSWMDKVGLIYSGVFGTVFSCLGYAGGCLGSVLQLNKALKALDQSTIDYYNTVDSRLKNDIALVFFKKMVEVAFFACCAAWGIFGGLHFVSGNVVCKAWADLLFLYSFSTFIAGLACAVIFPALEKEEKKPILFHKNGDSS